jgi:RNA polymerase sigma factor (sigma-70 family)
VGQSVNLFLEMHAALVLRLARKLARPPLSAEDVAQEAASSLLRWHRQGAFEPEKVENVEAYLRVVVRNVASREARRVRELSPALDRNVGGLSPEQPAYQAAFGEEELEARALLERLKASLRPRDALVFALLVEDGLTMDEVAETLGTTMNNVYQIRHRIRSRARELLDGSSAEHAEPGGRHDELRR